MITKIKLFASTAAVLATVFTFSSAQASDMMNMSDFYAGGYGGWGWTKTDVSGGSSVNLNGTNWGGFVGYNFGNMPSQQNLGMQLGVEAHYGWTAGTGTTTTVGGVPTSLEQKHEWGVDLRPGFASLISSAPLDIKPYAILGYRRTEFSDSTHSNSEHPGFALGLGTELVSYQHFGLRLDYDHVFFKSRDGLDPHENDLRAGLVYHF